MSEFQPFPGAALDRCGLNRHAVFDLADLPDDIVGSIAGGTTGYRQLILIGHGGRALWEAVRKSGVGGADPIDDFTLRTIRQWMSECQPDNRYTILYPGPQPIALQRLGALAGWHQASPFMVGIDAEWGTWYAYRAVVLADTHFAPSPAVDPGASSCFHDVALGHGRSSPCAACQDKPCIAACPASAMAGGAFSLQRCVAWRKQDGSTCALTCLARVACPVGSDHRYCPAQLAHTYSISLQTIKEHY
jgi:epoxyqueuosine reductase